MLQSFIADTFQEQDANHWRSVVEMAHILHLLHQRTPEAYQFAVLSRLKNSTFGCPTNVLEGLEQASSPKEVEVCINQLIQTQKNAKR